MARYVTIATVSHSPHPADFRDKPEALLNHAAHMVQRAARMGASIVAFPEVYPHLASGRKPAEVAEPIPGPSIQRMAEEAKRHRLHVIWPLFTREEGRLYNSAVLLSPGGDVAGVYHKMRPTIGEIEDGITPGTEASVFDVGWGRIGMAICFDLNFRDVAEGLTANGAEIIFFCSMYRGGMQLSIWAFEFGVYVASAIAAELGRIVDQSGAVLAESTYEALIARRINLDRKLLHMDYNWDKMDAMLEKYGPGISFEFFTREACYAVASEREDITVDDLIREFGLEERPAYFRRANEARARALAAGSV